MTIAPLDEPDIASAFSVIVLEPLPDDAPEWAAVLNANIGKVASGINQTNTTIASILDIANAVKEQVAPVIDSLSNSPMLKMLTGGKR